MSDLREQVTSLAAEGRILDLATAIVGAELDRLITLGARVAKWEPASTGVYPEQLGFPDIHFSGKPRKEGVQPVVAALGAVVFQLGPDDLCESFRAEPDFEEELAGDDWVLDIIRRFAGAYCSAAHTNDRPETVILSRPVLTEASAAQSSMIIHDQRRVPRLTPSHFPSVPGAQG